MNQTQSHCGSHPLSLTNSGYWLAEASPSRHRYTILFLLRQWPLLWPWLGVSPLGITATSFCITYNSQCCVQTAAVYGNLTAAVETPVAYQRAQCHCRQLPKGAWEAVSAPPTWRHTLCSHLQYPWNSTDLWACCLERSHPCSRWRWWLLQHLTSATENTNFIRIRFEVIYCVWNQNWHEIPEDASYYFKYK